MESISATTGLDINLSPQVWTFHLPPFFTTISIMLPGLKRVDDGHWPKRRWRRLSPIFASVDWVDILGQFLHKLLVAQVSWFHPPELIPSQFRSRPSETVGLTIGHEKWPELENYSGQGIAPWHHRPYQQSQISSRCEHSPGILFFGPGITLL